jgi:hypothetical protein
MRDNEGVAEFISHDRELLSALDESDFAIFDPFAWSQRPAEGSGLLNARFGVGPADYL